MSKGMTINQVAVVKMVVAYKCYQLSFELLSNYLELQQEHGSCSGSYFVAGQKHTLLLSILVLQNLVQITLQLNYPDEAHDYYRMMTKLRTEYHRAIDNEKEQRQMNEVEEADLNIIYDSSRRCIAPAA
jgi:hypothetical protein